MPLQQLCEDLTGHVVPLQAEVDNSAIIAIIAKGFSEGMRYLRRQTKIQIQLLKEIFENPNHQLKYVKTDENKSAGLTKVLNKAFKSWCESILLLAPTP